MHVRAARRHYVEAMTFEGNAHYVHTTLESATHSDRFLPAVGVLIEEGGVAFDRLLRDGCLVVAIVDTQNLRMERNHGNHLSIQLNRNRLRLAAV